MVKKPKEKKTNDQPTNPKTATSNILTNPKTLEYIKLKDKQYRESREKMFTKTQLAKNQDKSQDQSNKFNKPQPWIEGKDGMKCLSCEGEFGDRTMLESQTSWIQCPKCKSYHHYKCIQNMKECVCGWFIRCQRKLKE